MAKDSKNKKHFFKDVKAELKKVVWPTPEQLTKNTSAVIVIVLITAAIVFLLDLTFDTLNNQGLDRIKRQIINVSTVNTDVNATSLVENTNANENSGINITI